MRPASVPTPGGCFRLHPGFDFSRGTILNWFCFRYLSTASQRHEQPSVIFVGAGVSLFFTGPGFLISTLFFPPFPPVFLPVLFGRIFPFVLLPSFVVVPAFLTVQIGDGYCDQENNNEICGKTLVCTSDDSHRP